MDKVRKVEKGRFGILRVLLGILLSPLYPLSPLAWGQGPTLVVCDDVADPLSLNPLKEFDVRSDNIVFQMFEGLVRFSEDGKIEPCLATSWKRIDPLTMEFKLREGVTFHNGEPFNAAAVKFSIEKLIDPATHAACYMQVSTIQRVDLVGDFTVRIVTAAPDGLLLHRLPAFVKMLPPKYYEQVGEGGFDQHPVGTGPFKFQAWERGNRIILSANEKYWETGLPKIRTVIFRFVPSGEQVPLLLKGELDLVTELPGTFTGEVMKNRKTRVVKRACWVFSPILLCDRGPLKDERVRRALNYAVDRRALIRYLAQGNGVAMADWSMPGQVGHDPMRTLYPHDQERAKKLLKEAGYSSGFRLSLITSDQSVREAKAVAAQWEKIGVDTEVKSVPMSELFQEWGNPNKTWDCFSNLCPDPMGHIAFTYSIAMYSKSPFSGYRDPAFDGMFEKMLTTVDAKEQERAAQEVNRYVYDRAMGVFTYQRMKIYGLRENVDCDPHPSGSLYLRKVGVRTPK